MPEISEDILIKATQGDLSSFENVYRQTSSFVYNVAVGITNSREDAEEVTQEVFMIVYQKLKEFRFESSFKTWVYRITVNQAINFVKKTSRLKNRTMNIEDIQLEAAATSYGERDDQRNLLEQLLNLINPDQRICIVLRSMEGLSYQQIADVLKIPINTVRSRIKRAREIMLASRKEVVDYEL